jgi:hypothetical protein
MQITYFALDFLFSFYFTFAQPYTVSHDLLPTMIRTQNMLLNHSLKQIRGQGKAVKK